ncbi:MAG TPA: hypothetical protein VF845_03445 [Terriglobales bacterium]
MGKSIGEGAIRQGRGSCWIEYAPHDQLGFSWALAGFEIAVSLLALLVSLGPDSKGKGFVARERPG